MLINKRKISKDKSKIISDEKTKKDRRNPWTKLCVSVIVLLMNVEVFFILMSLRFDKRYFSNILIEILFCIFIAIENWNFENIRKKIDLILNIKIKIIEKKIRDSFKFKFL